MLVNKKTVLNENRVYVHVWWTEKSGKQIWFNWLSEAMFTLYWIDYRSTPKTVSDRPSVHIWPRWPITVPVTITSWNAPIPKVIHSISDSSLECSTLNVNDLFSRLVPFLERNLIIALLDLRVGLLLPDQSKYRSDMVWTAQLQTGPVWFNFPKHCSHCMRSIPELDRKSILYSVNIVWIWRVTSVIPGGQQDSCRVTPLSSEWCCDTLPSLSDVKG